RWDNYIAGNERMILHDLHEETDPKKLVGIANVDSGIWQLRLYNNAYIQALNDLVALRDQLFSLKNSIQECTDLEKMQSVCAQMQGMQKDIDVQLERCR